VTTADATAQAASGARAAPAAPDAPEAPGARRWAWLAGLLGVLAVALGLRLWGIAEGLPYVYNIDEGTHFVPRAVAMFGHTLNPHYFANPPGVTYAFRIVLGLWFGGTHGIAQAYSQHPTAVYVVARVTVAVLSTVAVWLLYLTGTRLAGRRVGLLAAAVLAVAFLPVYYGHLALNDAPTLAPLTLSLLGSAGVLRRGRSVDYLMAGGGLGLACAFKYTAGVAVLALLAAVLLRARAGARAVSEPRSGPGGSGGGADGARSAILGLIIAAFSALLFFLIANPYSALDFSHFRAGLAQQSSLSEAVGGKLGSPRNGGLSYYLWTLTWGLGWAPALAAIGGAVALWWRDRGALLVLVPAPVAFLIFMGTEGRYFGRWLLPIFPSLCLLAAILVVAIAQRAPARRPLLRGALLAAGAVALLAQGIVFSVHSGLVLSRADTRGLARSWMVANVPVAARVVVEPVVPEAWLRDIGRQYDQVPGGERWTKWPALRSVITPAGTVDPSHSQVVTLEDYERTLSPQLIAEYERSGYCWVLTATTESGRATADPRGAPLALAYYRALARDARVAFYASPYRVGARPVAFNFDWSFDYYNLAYRRPGPAVTVYRLSGGRCAHAA
jgi:hypothetical protein